MKKRKIYHYLNAFGLTPWIVLHVFHSEKMGDKYLKRYHKHYADPEIIPFPCGHEGWLGNPQLMIESFRRCMKTEPNKD